MLERRGAIDKRARQSEDDEQDDKSLNSDDPLAA
ncbi:hypothetical protein B0G57_11435 [Trinickia symbiotica]|nr:hypothetical protein B0G57_11435 [Trinickia symbiotica]